MRKIVQVVPLLAVVALAACSSGKIKNAATDWKYPSAGALYTVAPAPVKDFDVKGVIFITSQVTYDVNGDKNGSEITYEMLMREAVKLGADDVINVRIDEEQLTKAEDTYQQDVLTHKEQFASRKTLEKTVKYTATALAIKYTKVVDGALLTSGKGAGSLQVQTASAQPAVAASAVVVPAAPASGQKHSVFSRKAK